MQPCCIKGSKGIALNFKELKLQSEILTTWMALGIGFLHALEPGHGKTALFTFLASKKNSWAEGLVISFSSAFTHSIVVFVIALVSHYVLHHSISKDRIHEVSHVLALMSGGLIFGLGLWVILKTRRGEHLDHCCAHHHSDHSKTNHTPQKNFVSSSLIGVATGMIPCPTVIVAYLSGVSNGNSYLGLQSVLFFAIGMFFALLSVIILFNIGGQRIISRFIEKRTSSFRYPGRTLYGDWSFYGDISFGFYVLGFGTFYCRVEKKVIKGDEVSSGRCSSSY